MAGNLAIRVIRLLAALTVAIGALGAQPAHANSNRDYRLRDDCEPTSFNAALGAGACVGNGSTTLSQFQAELKANHTRIPSGNV